MRPMIILIVTGALGTIPKRSERLGNKRTSEDPPNYSIDMLGQNIERNPGELRGRAVT